MRHRWVLPQIQTKTLCREQLIVYDRLAYKISLMVTTFNNANVNKNECINGNTLHVLHRKTTTANGAIKYNTEIKVKKDFSESLVFFIPRYFYKTNCR